MKKDFLDTFYKNLSDKEEDSSLTSMTLSMAIISEKIYSHAKHIHDKYDLTRAEVDLLATLNIYGGELTASQISDRMVFTSGGMSKVIKKLELKKLIYKKESTEDKRSSLLHIEQKGKDILDKCLPELKQAHRHFLGVLNETEKDILEKALKKVLYNSIEN